jgi:hypothetical protein
MALTHRGRNVVVSACLLSLAGSAMAQPEPQPSPELQRLLDGARERHETALRAAADRGWDLAPPGVAPQEVALHSLLGGLPRWYATDNANAADTVGTDELHPGGSTGLGLTGAGVAVGIWDGGGVLLSHQEFGGRASQMDFPSGLSSHASHVAGTMVAGGARADAEGMAPGATLECFDFYDDLDEMWFAGAGDLRLSNHSYGFISGWRQVIVDYGDGAGPAPSWAWYGDAAVSAFEDYTFGYYGSTAQAFDQLARDHPRYLSVHSAGNDRDDDGPGPNGRHVFFDPFLGYALVESYTTRSPDGPWDCLGSSKTAKNTLVVGSVLDINGGWSSPGDVVQNDFSGTGPTDDGRIKPDIVANGNNLLSADATGPTDYWYASGTSMACPNASGTIALLLQHWRGTLGGADPLSSTLKAIVIHAADEAGPAPGPDYQHGWGLLDAVGAAGLITEAATNPITIQERSIPDGGSVEVGFVPIDPARPVRATMVWTDPAATPLPPSLDNPTLMLVNDLHLAVEDSVARTTFHPWTLFRLNPSAPAAQTGPNFIDNVEVVDFSPSPGRSYVARITHGGSITGGSQSFSLILSNAAAPTPTCEGDVDGDGVTNTFDFGDLADNFGAGPGATREMGDLNGDGFVNTFDFGILADDFGCPN